jgi:AcrR family transcriptional regulator
MSSSEPSLTAYGIRKPVQRRSRAVVTRILKATNDLLNEDSLEQLTMQRVAQRADVSVGSIYRYYADKLDLLRAVQDGALQDAEVSVMSSIAEADPTVEGVVSALVDGLDRVLGERARALSAFFSQMGVDPVLAARAQAADRTILVAFYAGLERDRARVTHDDLNQAARVALELIAGLFMWYARSQNPDFRKTVGAPDRAMVAREARRAGVSYLLGPEV